MIHADNPSRASSLDSAHGRLAVAKTPAPETPDEELKRLRMENAKLRQLVAELSLDKHMLQDYIWQNYGVRSRER